jgi:hypothetical protein
MKISIALVVCLILCLVCAGSEPPASPPVAPASPAVTPASAPTSAAPAPPATLPATSGCVYKGKPRTEQWVNTQYARFRDKIMMVEGKAVDLDHAPFALEEIGLTPPQAPALVRRLPPRAKVLQVLKPTEILVYRSFYAGRSANYQSMSGRFMHWAPGTSPTGDGGGAGSPAEPELLFHLRGIDATNLSENAPLSTFNEPRATPVGGGSPSAIVVYVGTFQYPGADGTLTTVQSYQVPSPITKQEFAAALNSGLELVGQTTKTRIIRRSGDRGPPQTETYVVSDPVP